MLEPYDGDALAPPDEELLEALAHNLPPEVCVSDAQVETWLEGLDREARDWSLTWGDVMMVSLASAVSAAIVFAPLMTFTAAMVVALVGVAYGTMLRSMTRVIPVA